VVLFNRHSPAAKQKVQLSSDSACSRSNSKTEAQSRAPRQQLQQQRHRSNLCFQEHHLSSKKKILDRKNIAPAAVTAGTGKEDGRITKEMMHKYGTPSMGTPQAEMIVKSAVNYQCCVVEVAKERLGNYRLKQEQLC
jgi:ABC-type histidine transport system ATPase subunit